MKNQKKLQKDHYKNKTGLKTSHYCFDPEILGSRPVVHFIYLFF